MTESKIEKIITIKENLERVLDNLKDGIIAHDIKRRIFFSTMKLKELQVSAEKMFWEGTVTKYLMSPFAVSAVLSVKTTLKLWITMNIRLIS